MSARGGFLGDSEQVGQAQNDSELAVAGVGVS